jgi:hypothetical protein
MANERRNINMPLPAFRSLRGYAFDPIVSLNLDTSDINEILYKVPWEKDLKPGPEGEYIHVIDRDPASNAVYAPVDLNDPHLLAMNGIAPTESNPQFHQQMVYAVIMTTISNFEKALGRRVIWSSREYFDKGKYINEYVRKLVVFPHAFRDQNAYYSPERKALLFGYYKATPANASVYLPGGIVHACLSHDIIAHETTHALLDSMHNRFMESTNPDVPAFHEGFADIVALLQHFMYPDIVKNQIRKVRGNLEMENLLLQLALEFGQSTGQVSALRDAIGVINEDGKWVRRPANTSDYNELLECHARGNLLVDTIFDAFIAIYKSRTADLIRINTGGSGILPAGDIHPDLVNRLADEASKSASHMLNMCVRALDYCPPVDIRFGDYLRAMITADTELVANDDRHYRIAVINAFRKRGIYASGVSNFSVEALVYNDPDKESEKSWFGGEIYDYLKLFKERLSYETDREVIYNNTKLFIKGDKSKNIKGFHEYFFGPKNKMSGTAVAENLTGLIFSDQYKEFGIDTSRAYGKGAAIEIHSLKLNCRVGPDGNALNQIVLTLGQRCHVKATQGRDDQMVFTPVLKKSEFGKENVFVFRAGCTMIFDLDDLSLKHVISKPLFRANASLSAGRKLELNDSRLSIQYESMFGNMANEIGFTQNQPKGTELLEGIHKSKRVSYAW